MLQARLELALGYTPNWILSPTRLPIPPLEPIQFSITFWLQIYSIINIIYCQTENFISHINQQNKCPRQQFKSESIFCKDTDNIIYHAQDD